MSGVAVLLAVMFLAGCQTTRHECVVTPNNLVDCHVVDEEPVKADQR